MNANIRVRLAAGISNVSTSPRIVRRFDTIVAVETLGHLISSHLTRHNLPSFPTLDVLQETHMHMKAGEFMCGKPGCGSSGGNAWVANLRWWLKLKDAERQRFSIAVLFETRQDRIRRLLQRRMAIGYSRASRLVDQMGLAGILSDHKGSVAREVLISLEDWQRMKRLEAGLDASNNAEDLDGDFGEEDSGGVPAELPGEHRY